jgi:hypothetical protein
MINIINQNDSLKIKSPTFGRRPFKPVDSGDKHLGIEKVIKQFTQSGDSFSLHDVHDQLTVSAKYPQRPPTLRQCEDYLLRHPGLQKLKPLKSMPSLLSFRHKRV